jgi:hypothetical protein
VVPITSAARTAFDLARRSSFVDAVIAVDAMVRVAPYCLEELERMAKERAWPGTAALPEVLAAADMRSESPMETRVRLILVGAGLPRPVAQYSVVDARGRAAGRVDLAYPAKKVGIEYEGARHRESAVFQKDLRRFNRMSAAGWRILRFGPDDVFNRPEHIVDEVRRALER